jgi:succinate-semialdehyde dehydrogenase/glutarate-semialdehyde dehydrogenase/succinate-semialdehyde dehydrogenase
MRVAQRTWRTTPVEDRCAGLLRLSQLLLAHQAPLAEAICAEVGKLLPECHAEVEKAARLCHYYADLAPDGPKRGLAEIEPLMPALRQG